VDGLLVLAVVVLGWLFLSGGGQPNDTGNDPYTADYPDDSEQIGMTGGTNAIAQAIARFEGFFVPGSLPNRTNNPGDIGTFNGKIARYDTPAAGFASLDQYIASHAIANPGWDFYDFFRYYLTGDTMGTPGPKQNPDAYAEFVAAQVGADPTDPVSQWLG
jgi:hypothetical protein